MLLLNALFGKRLSVHHLARIGIIFLLFSLICPGLVKNSAAKTVVRGTDSLGDSYVVTQRPLRVVSLVPELTETLIALDAADALVGITQHTVAPEVADKKIIGGFRAPEIGQIEALNPDLILAADLHHEVREYFRGKCPVITLNVIDIDDAMARLALLGRIFDRQEAAERIIAQNRMQLDHIARKVAGITAEQRQRVVRLMGHENLLVPGDNSFQNDFIRAAGAIPPEFGKKGQAVTVTTEEWQSFDPQVVYVCGAGDLPDILSDAGVKEVSAVRNDRVYSFSCNLTCRAGINIGNFVALLADRIYGEEIPGLAPQMQDAKPTICVMDEK